MSVNYNPSVVTSGLILNLDAGNVKSYPGSGATWTDLSQNGNNGTLVNGPTFNSANGGSLVFDGVNDYATILISSPSSFSVSIFFKISSFTSNDMRLFGPYTGLTNQLATGFNSSTFRVWDGGTWRNTNVVCSTNTVYNITITYTTLAYNYYLNGSFMGSSVSSAIIFANVGISNSANLTYGSYFNGNIYSFSIYNRALSAAEIAQNYNALRGRYGL
jgi:hypothetical protein